MCALRHRLIPINTLLVRLQTRYFGLSRNKCTGNNKSNHTRVTRFVPTMLSSNYLELIGEVWCTFDYQPLPRRHVAQWNIFYMLSDRTPGELACPENVTLSYTKCDFVRELCNFSCEKIPAAPMTMFSPRWHTEVGIRRQKTQWSSVYLFWSVASALVVSCA